MGEAFAMLTLGMDIGSITTKAVVLDNNKILGSKIIFTGFNATKAGEKVVHELLAELSLHLEKIEKIVATGYGRKSVAFAHNNITEITCHAKGAHFLDNSIRSIIDIGGQDSKVIVLDENGKVKDFAMNDKCAAGTGRFLEVMARAMEVDLDEFGELSLKANNPAKISSLCTVFAESEVISLIAKGETRDNIIAGIHQSIASRIISMANRVGITNPVMMTGGVAKNIGVVKAIEKLLDSPVKVSDNAQIIGALGAALMAAEN